MRKWWWLLLAATLVAAVSSFLASTRQEPIFRSSTTLIIGSSIEDLNPSTGELVAAEQLAAIYADIAKRETIRTATSEALGLNNLPQYTAEALPQSQLIEISVLDTVPIRAQAVARELANQLILQGPSNTDSEDEERIAFVNEQLDRIQTQIEETEGQIEELQIQLGELNSALQIQEMEQQINALESKLTSLQSNYANLIATTQQGATNTLTVIEPANLPRRPVNQNLVLTIALAAAVGFGLAALAAYLLEYLDKSIKTPEDISQIFHSPLIGFIPKFPAGVNGRPYVLEHPSSAITEAFRSLRINLEFAASETPLKSIFLTSADASAGKTTVSINLAIILAQGGYKVFLVDADLRRPSIHEYLGISNKKGLVDILRGELDFRNALIHWEPNLEVIPAGRLPSGSAELLNSDKLDQVLINMNLLADYVIIDGPPILVTDAFVLASKVDGVLVVVQPGRTDKDLAVSVEEQIERVGTPVVGVVFNQIPKNDLSYYGKHWYYSPHYSSQYLPEENEGKDSSPAPTSRWKLPAFLAGIMGSSQKAKTQPKPPTPKESKPANTTPLNPAVLQGTKTAANPPSPPKAKGILRWEESEGIPKKLVLREGDNILIGRDRINDVTINSRHVSRRHAVITWRKNFFEIADLGSTNGTQVNGQLIEKPAELKSGDVIRLFDSELNFELIRPTSTQNQSAGEAENLPEPGNSVSN
jgi:capsular exopolysaccharide synthesis family protein